MTPAEQIKEDKKLVERVDSFGKNLSSAEVSLVESCLRRVQNNQPLSDAQRTWLQDIDDQKVGN